MYYRNELGFTYPERSDQHMLTLKRSHEVSLSAEYEYMPHGAWFCIKRALVASVLHLVVFPVMHLTHGLRIYGRKNLRKHKKELVLKGKKFFIAVRNCLDAQNLFQFRFQLIQK